MNVFVSFQSYINQTLSDCLDLLCVMYLDDILIFSKTQTEYVQHVRTVLQKLRKYKLYVKLSKCQFYVTEIEFLKFKIFIQSVFMKPDCVKIIVKWLKSQEIKDIQVFLRFANFYRRFIKKYFYIAKFMITYLKIKSVKNSIQK